MAKVLIDPKFLARYFFGGGVVAHGVEIVAESSFPLIGLHVEGVGVPDAELVSAEFETFDTLGGGSATRFRGFSIL